MNIDNVKSSFVVVMLLLSSMHAPACADDQIKEQGAAGERLEATAAVPLRAAQSVQRLADVKRVFVASLGTSQDSETIRQNIINALIESKMFSVVDSADDADAILVGAVQERSYYSWSANSNGSYGQSYGLGSGYSYGHASGQTQYAVTGAVRLVNKNKQVLWTYSTHVDRRPGLFPRYTRSNLVSSLKEAIQKDQERNQIGYSH